jgi:hypothetical protein
MRDVIILLVHMITPVVRVVQPGGVRAVIAESVLTKHQLLILNRSHRRAPNLWTLDRVAYKNKNSIDLVLKEMARFLRVSLLECVRVGIHFLFWSSLLPVG